MKASAKKSGPGDEIVLLSSIGISPAVLTETLWALAHENPPTVPDRVVVLTTACGADKIVRDLLDPNPDFGGDIVWDRLRRALETEGHDLAGRLVFGRTAHDIRVFTAPDANGRTRHLNDIRHAAEVLAAGDVMMETLRSFTENPEVRIVASLSGGRKSMAASLHACMMLLGRETDRLTHVLVDAPYGDARNRPSFYFPAQGAPFILTADQTSVDAARACIELVDIPFMPLRKRFEDLADKPGGYSAMIAQYSPPPVRNCRRKVRVQVLEDAMRVVIDGTPVPIQRMRTLLTLQFLIEINRKPPLPPGQLEAVEPFIEFVRRRKNGRAIAWTPTGDDLRRETSELRRLFRQAGIVWSPGLRRDALALPPFTTS